jgi:PAS domain S-box-containing protein
VKRGIDGDAEALGRVLEAVQEIVLVVDPDGTIRYINRVEEGYLREEVIGAQADQIVSPGSRDAFWKALRSVLRGTAAEELESSVEAPDGEIRWYRSHMAPLRKEGRVVAAVLLATNVTELKAARDRVGRLERLLPICSWCERIQDEAGEWNTVEDYLSRGARTKVSHGICPDCQQDKLGGAGLRDDGANGSVA